MPGPVQADVLGAELMGGQLSLQTEYDRKPIEPLVNASVDSLDEERLIKHVRRMYRLFWVRHITGTLVSTLDLQEYGKGQYNARLNELRRALIPFGQCIDKIPRENYPEQADEGVHYYKLVGLTESTYFAARREKLIHLVKKESV